MPPLLCVLIYLSPVLVSPKAIAEACFSPSSTFVSSSGIQGMERLYLDFEVFSLFQIFLWSAP